MPTPGASAAPSGADPGTDPPSAGGAVDASMGSVTTPAPADATGSVTTQASGTGSPALMVQPQGSETTAVLMMQQMQEMMTKALNDQRLMFESTMLTQRAEHEAKEQAQLAKQRELLAELAAAQTRNMQAQRLVY